MMMYYNNPHYPFGIFIALLVILIACFVYFLPSIIAINRKTDNIILVFIINFFFGITFVGWIIAMFFALSADKKKDKKCPFCFSYINENARKCSHCGEWVDGSNKAENKGE